MALTHPAEHFHVNTQTSERLHLLDVCFCLRLLSSYQMTMFAVLLETVSDFALS